MTLVLTTNIGGGQNTYYDKKFLKRAIEEVIFAPFGQARPLPKGEGKTIQFFRYNNIATSMSGSWLTEGTNPSETSITGQDISVDIEEWGGFSKHSSLIKDTHIDRNLAGVSTLWGENAANTVDLIAMSASVTGGSFPWRADGNNSGSDAFSFTGTIDSATTTTFVDVAASSNTDYGDGNDDFNQSIIIITSGTGYGQSRPCTDWVTGTSTGTVSPAWDVTPAAGDTYKIVSPHATTTSHVLTTANIRAAVVQLRNNRAATFSGGFYVGVLSPDTEAGLMADTNWTNVMQYRDRPEMKVNGLFKGEVGEWGGVRWVRTTQPFRFPIETVGTAGTAGGPGTFVPGTSYTNYAADGAVFANMILGRESFGTTTFSGGNIMRPRIIIKNPGPQSTDNPLDRFSTVGWYLPYIAKGLNPMFAIQLWTGA